MAQKSQGYSKKDALLAKKLNGLRSQGQREMTDYWHKNRKLQPENYERLLTQKSRGISENDKQLAQKSEGLSENAKLLVQN